MAKHSVVVSGKSYVIDIAKRGERFWIAAGHFMDGPLKVQAENEDAVLKRWCKAAAYMEGDEYA